MNKDKKKNNIINFPKKKSKIEREIEAIIFAAEEPLDIDTIEKRIGSNLNIKKILENLQAEYSSRGINLINKSSILWGFFSTSLSFLPMLPEASTKLLFAKASSSFSKAISNLFSNLTNWVMG